MKKVIRRTELAANMGLKTATIAMWDRKGRGPAGRFYLTKTMVAYPAEEVEKWFRERRLNPETPTPLDSRDERGRILAMAKAETTPAKGSS